MATATFTVPRTTFPVGTTQNSGPVSGVTVHSFSVASDVSAVVLDCSVAEMLEYSTDNGVTWLGAGGGFISHLPDTDDGGNPVAILGFGNTFDHPVTPTNWRLTVTVTQNAAPVGPTTVKIT